MVGTVWRRRINGIDYGDSSEVLVEIPQARGVDVYIFAGPSLREAVQRYNLFSGAGPLPPRWGLGFWYRVETDFSQAEVLKMAEELRERKIPCDVLGLEPGWQTHAYSCSFLWDTQKFPDPAATVSSLKAMNYQLNLWEHAYLTPPRRTIANSSQSPATIKCSTAWCPTSISPRRVAHLRRPSVTRFS